MRTKRKTTEITPTRNADVPSLQQIRNHILQRIHAGEWKKSDQIPTEAAPSGRFRATGMTVNRALRELASEQSVSRIQGLGTYVAQHKQHATLVAIRSISDEVRGRGHHHACAIKVLESVRTPAALAWQFDAGRAIWLFHAILVHYENEIQIQMEDCWVNTTIAPDYLRQDFSHTTPNEYLMRVTPLQDVIYRLEAKIPPTAIRELLAMAAREPCLVLYRTTRLLGMVASVATMWHQASQQRFAGSLLTSAAMPNRHWLPARRNCLTGRSGIAETTP